MSAITKSDCGEAQTVVFIDHAKVTNWRRDGLAEARHYVITIK